MACPLLALESKPTPPFHFLYLHESTTLLLRRTFQDKSNVLPLLFLSQMDLSFFLQSLIEAGSPNEGSNFDLTVSDTKAYVSKSWENPVVYVWPLPVQLHGFNLLLVHMWDFDVSQAEESELAIRALSGLTAMAGYCFGCWEAACAVPAKEHICRLYETIKETTGLTLAKLLCFNTEIAGIRLRKRSRSYSDKSYVTSLPYTRLQEPGLMEDLLADQALGDYFETHREAQKQLHCQTEIDSLLRILEICVKTANLDLHCDQFLAELPSVTSPRIDQDLLRLEQLENEQKRLRSAEAVPFLLRFQDQFRLDKSLLTQLVATFNPELPTVVLTVLGGPGLGKSTLLNRILQRVAATAHPFTTFAEGNTELHTTRGSLVLSAPLQLPNGLQTMLVDLEGLGGLDAGEGQNGVVQANLIASILTVASLPCILVRNEEAATAAVQRYISRISDYERTFGFLIERVLFLYQDKDFSAPDPSSPMSLWVESLNAQYFESRPVIKLLHKPNFVCEQKAAMCESFLTALLAECQYPKRRQSGLELTIGDILAQLELLAEHENTDIWEMSIKSEDLTRVDALYRNAARELETIYEGLTSSPAITLVEQLNSRFKVLLHRVCLECPQLAMQKSLCTRLEISAQSLRLRLVSLENGYRELSSLTSEQRNELIGKLLAQFSREAWWSPDFYRRAQALEGRLQEMQRRFPALELEEQRRQLDIELRRLTKYPLGDVIHSISAFISRIFACSEVHPEPPIRTVVESQATELLANKENQLVWNLSELEKCSSQASVLPLLLLSRGALSASEVLNSLVSRLAPFTTAADYQSYFTRNRKAQVLSIHYPGRPCNILLIYLNLPTTLASRTDTVLTDFAHFLASKVAVNCMIDTVDEQLGGQLLERKIPAEGDNRIATDGEPPSAGLYIYALVGEHMARPCTVLRKALGEAGTAGEVKCYKVMDEVTSVAIQSDILTGLGKVPAVPFSSFQASFRAAAGQ